MHDQVRKFAPAHRRRGCGHRRSLTGLSPRQPRSIRDPAGGEPAGVGCHRVFVRVDRAAGRQQASLRTVAVHRHRRVSAARAGVARLPHPVAGFSDLGRPGELCTAGRRGHGPPRARARPDLASRPGSAALGGGDRLPERGGGGVLLRRAAVAVAQQEVDARALAVLGELEHGLLVAGGELRAEGHRRQVAGRAVHDRDRGAGAARVAHVGHLVAALAELLGGAAREPAAGRAVEHGDRHLAGLQRHRVRLRALHRDRIRSQLLRRDHAGLVRGLAQLSHRVHADRDQRDGEHREHRQLRGPQPPGAAQPTVPAPHVVGGPAVGVRVAVGGGHGRSVVEGTVPDPEGVQAREMRAQPLLELVEVLLGRAPGALREGAQPREGHVLDRGGVGQVLGPQLRLHPQDQPLLGLVELLGQQAAGVDVPKKYY